MRTARRHPLTQPPPFLRTPEAAVDWAVSREMDAGSLVSYSDEDIYDVASEYVAKAYEIVAAGSVVLYRAIRVPRKGGLHNVNWDCLGKAWTVDRLAADVYGIPSHGNSVPTRDVVLIGEVDAQHIDWEYGFSSFVIYGSSQWEISLLPHSPVLVHGVILRDPQVEHRFTIPIKGSTGTAGEYWGHTCSEIKCRPRRLDPGVVSLDGWWL